LSRRAIHLAVSHNLNGTFSRADTIAILNRERVCVTKASGVIHAPSGITKSFAMFVSCFVAPGFSRFWTMLIARIFGKTRVSEVAIRHLTGNR